MAKKKQRNEGEVVTMLNAAIDKGEDLTGLVYEIETEYESPAQVTARKAKERAVKK